MLQPQILGVLNNCPVHILTPTLKREIERLTRSSHDYQREYENLKTCFGEYYAINTKDLDWPKFNQLLQKYNAHDIQILFGPVLRMFFSAHLRCPEAKSNIQNMKAADEATAKMGDEEFIKHVSQIQDMGRYVSLSPDEVFNFISRPLGINMIYHKNGRESSLGGQNFRPLETINIYHEGSIDGAMRGGHWELTAEAGDFEPLTIPSQMEGLSLLFRRDDKRVTEFALGILNQLVRLMFDEIVSGEDQQKARQQCMLSVTQLDTFLLNMNRSSNDSILSLTSGSVCSRRVVVLGPELTSDARDFIQDYASFYLSAVIPEPIKPNLEFKTLKRQDDIDADRSSLSLQSISSIHTSLSQKISVMNTPQVSVPDERALNVAVPISITNPRKQPLFERRESESVTSDSSDLSESDSDDVSREMSRLPNERMSELIHSLKQHLSTSVWMGIRLDEKTQQLDKLLLRCSDEPVDLQSVFVDLVKVVTTHRTRFGCCFFHISRHNSSTTNTAVALSNQLAKPKYAELRRMFGLTALALLPENIRFEFDLLVGGGDHYPFSL